MPITVAPRNAAPATAPRPTPPHPNTATVSSRGNPSPRNRMKSDRQRLDQAQLLQRQIGAEQLRRRRRNELRQRAVALHAQRLVELARIGPVPQAGGALSRNWIVRRQRHRRSRLPNSVSLRTSRNHGGRDLVPRNARKAHQRVASAIGIQIAAAQPDSCAPAAAPRLHAALQAPSHA